MPLTSGAYRISSGSKWLRGQGDFVYNIIVDGIESPRDGDAEFIWWLEPMGEPADNRFAIVNHTPRYAAEAPPRKGQRIIGVPESADSLKWSIEPAGHDHYHIHFPEEDLVWTVDDKIVVLNGLQGEPGQLWQFHWVGDF